LGQFRPSGDKKGEREGEGRSARKGTKTGKKGVDSYPLDKKVRERNSKTTWSSVGVKGGGGVAWKKKESIVQKNLEEGQKGGREGGVRGEKKPTIEGFRKNTSISWR